MVGAAPRAGQNVIGPRDQDVGAEGCLEDIQFLSAQAGAGAGRLADRAVILDEDEADFSFLERGETARPGTQAHEFDGDAEGPLY